MEIKMRLSQKSKTLLERLAIGATGLAVATALMYSSVMDNRRNGKILARELTPSGDRSYRIDTLDNITVYTTPRVRIGIGSVTKYVLSKDSEKYQQLMNNRSD